jgi:hypothetical protein
MEEQNKKDHVQSCENCSNARPLKEKETKSSSPEQTIFLVEDFFHFS